MKIKEPSIVLVRPQLPENIGLTARAMYSCGLKKLIIVSPREKWPNQKSINSSAKAYKIINKTKVYTNLQQALSNFNFVIGTSARKRFLEKPHIDSFSNLFSSNLIFGDTAILFGPENSGLSNDDLMLCDTIFSIPLKNKNFSLNLSHAVLLLSYKWQELKNNKKLISNSNIHKISKKKDFNNFMNFLKNELEISGFLKPKIKNKSMFHNIQTMFLRAKLNKKEIQTLWGMIKNLKNN